ncbi:MAG: patatin-like phospholipase family protein [Thiothrix sp.]|uniref:patatin-like phospholipase family protein n=1 Tax=Thiothrix sp. TaxID=1032 RepID=UPI002621B9F3|nr:patatin-like phospholipase family protein [Thiothrix sp.]MDD5395599.1 patatin-like phospholipase family protein [Thiothrix sp.]
MPDSSSLETKPPLYGDEKENKVIQDGRKACYPNDESQLSEPKFGLAFSGGGIRSATFNLGVLQGLAEAHLLKRIDYLSTVSGGGYIGSWFSALLHRKAIVVANLNTNNKKTNKPDASHVKTALDKLQDELTPEPKVSQTDQKLPKGESSIQWLRRYSAYLTPRYGLFSLDTLAALAGLFRNLLLNQTILICLLMAILLAPYLLMRAGRWMATIHGNGLFTILSITTGVLLIAAIFLVRVGLTRPDSRNALPAVIAALLGSCGAVLIFYLNQHQQCLFLPAISKFGGVLYALTWLISPQWKNWKMQCWAAISGVALGLMLYGYGELLRPGYIPANLLGAFSLVLGPVILLQILCMAALIHIGLVGRGFSEINREWLGRAGGQVFALEMAWVAFTSLALFAPALIDYLSDWIAYSGGVAWALGSVATFWLARSDKSGGKNTNPLLEKWLGIAPYLIVLGLLIALSTGLHNGLLAYSGIKKEKISEAQRSDYTITIKDKKFEKFEATPLDSQPNMRQSMKETLQANVRIDFYTLLGAFGISLLIGTAFARRIDVNVFSMHQFYRSRLARAYLGASNTDRKPNPFVDFDEYDDLALSELARQRPVHLVNTTLNLTKVTNNELQWQERRGISFLFSPHYCGYQLSPQHQHYVPTEKYMRSILPEQKGVMLGTAIAISGAAASPNMGYHSSPPLAFLMTFFNIRLGRWCPNTAGDEIGLSSPREGLPCLLSELFGSTNINTKFVNLTDGGHFENLGIYELVRRRCKLILVSDSGADSMEGFEFEDLGNAIQKCRVDFGVDIKMFGMEKLLPRKAKSRMAYGRIKYDDQAENDGVLIYLKPVLRGNEPMDIYHYAATHHDFPHQGTGDQWFEESQFESYRELGLITVREMLKKLGIPGDNSNESCLDFINRMLALCEPFIHPAKII